MSLIPEEIIAQIIDRSNIVGLISSYIPLKRAGQNFKALCPFHHEKTPSFIVNPDKQIFHCFGCGVGGNSITFIMQQEHLNFPEAVRMMAEKIGITIPIHNQNSQAISFRQKLIYVNELAASFFHKILLSDTRSSAKRAREYLKRRNVNLEIVKAFKIGFAPDGWDSLLTFLQKKDVTLGLMEKAGLIVAKERNEGFYDRFRERIIFPIFDVKGRCIAFGARALQDGIAKYINSPETDVYTKGSHLYGFHLAKNALAHEDCAIVVEGYMDFVMPYQAGVCNITASLGTALTTEQIRLLRRYTRNITMLFDGDTAGEAAMLRSLDSLLEEGMDVRVVTLGEGEDPDSFMRNFGLDCFREKLREGRSIFDYKLAILRKKYNDRSIEGKGKISDEMLYTINKFQNAVIKFEYVKRLAEILSTSEEVLLKELERISLGVHRKVEDRTYSTQTISKNHIRVVEYNLLQLLLDDKNFIPLMREELSLFDFQDEMIRTIIAKIFELFDQDKKIDVTNLMNYFHDPETLKIISLSAVENDSIWGDKSRMFRDCIERVKRDRNKSQRQDLLQQIKSAEFSGDHNRLNGLKEEFNHLIKR